MHLKEVQIENFRGFESVTVRFHERLTVLVGVNGSGKTTVLDAVVHALPPAVGSVAPIQAWHVRTGADDASIAVAYAAEIGGTSHDFGATVSARDNNPMRAPPPVVGDQAPVVVYFSVRRHAVDATPAAVEPERWGREETWDLRAHTHFAAFFRWFREREDLENEDIRADPAHRDNQLQAVRGAINRALSGYTNPRVHRTRHDSRDVFRRPVLVVSKDGQDFAFDQLSEGERIVTAMVADVARRLCIANDTQPLQGRGVVLIDEIELHLHPKWQADIIPALRRTFPNLQFIVTTHSPIVLSRVPTECVRVLEDFKVYDAPGKTEGRDPNGLLMEVFDTPLRPADVQRALGEIARLIDDDDIAAARENLEALAQRLGDHDSEVTRLRTVLDVLAS